MSLLDKLDLTKLDLTKLDLTKLDLTKLDPRKVDLSQIDLTKVRLPEMPRISRDDLPKIDLPKVDLPKVDLPEIDWSKIDLTGLGAGLGLGDIDEKVASVVKDAVYISIGFGVLAVQKAQVRRRELAGQLSERLGATRDQVDELLKSVEEQVRGLANRRAA